VDKHLIADPEEIQAVFVDALKGSAGSRPVPPNVGVALARLWEAGRAAWPGLDLDAPRFARHLAERIPLDRDIERALNEVHFADLYLACACTHGLKGAIERFEASYASVITAFIRRVDGSESFADEVRQIVRYKLFVAENGASPPKIATYSGRGSLASWVGVAAQRTGISLARSTTARAETDDEPLAEALPPGVDPDLDYLKKRYQTEFREAFQAALAALTQRERVILRLHYVTGMSHQKIASLYKVHQATVTRWIAKAGDTIASEAQRHLRERLSANTSEFHSLAQLVVSEIDLSLVRLLNDEHP
jgi:RNA polymerase sigma-70 factor, ECF subfamily